MVLIWNFFESVVNQIDNRLNVISVGEYVNGTQSITVSDWKFFDLKKLVNNKKASRSGNVITIQGLTEPLTLNSVVTIPLPLFMNGTLSNTKYEWSEFEKDEFKKLPFIWLVSPTRVTENESYRVSATLWFVHRADWTRSNSYRHGETLQPLSRLIDAFKQSLKNNTYVSSIPEYELGDFPKFGTESKDGIEKAVFNSKLGAFEVNISFDLLKYCNFGNV